MTYKKKSNVLWMRLLGRFAGPWFMSEAWTTIGDTIFVPARNDKNIDWGTPEWEKRNDYIIRHERVHIEQWERLGWLLFLTLYLGPAVTIGLPALLLAITLHLVGVGLVLPLAIVLLLVLLPLSVGLAYGRWMIEREAYMVQYDKAVAFPTYMVSGQLQKNYLYPWPKRWMEKWFQRNTDRGYEEA